jgi:hypothetical protein
VSLLHTVCILCAGVVEFFDDDAATVSTDVAAGDAPESGESTIVGKAVGDSDSSGAAVTDPDEDELLSEAALKMAQTFRKRAIDTCMEALEQCKKAPDVSAPTTCT